MTKPKTKKRNKEFKTPGGSPSICEWSLTFTFKTREQCELFIQLLFKEARKTGPDTVFNTIPSFTYQEEHVDTYMTFTITIHDYSWAGNLVTIANILQEVDFDFNE